jgi:signal transduction histidine kinase
VEGTGEPWSHGVVANERTWDAELARVDAVRGLELLGTPPEERFDRITRMAGDLLGTPISFLSLMDLDRLFLKASVGLPPFGDVPREDTLCTHTISAGQLLEIPDAAGDPRYAGNPGVAGPPHLRFYAGHPLRDQDGNVLGTLCVADSVPRTLTKWQREQLAGLARWAELELAAIQTARAAERARKARADFVSVVSHELRTPLTSIHGSLELLDSGRFGDLTPQVEQLVRIAAKNTDRLVRLADDVLVLSRLQDGMLRLRLAEVELAEVVSNAVDAVSGLAAGVTLAGEVPALRLRGDHDRLVQVFTNLLANALRVAPAGSAVRFGTHVADTHVSVDVRDEGPGVPQAQLVRIFEPFVQLEGGTGGAGLGLAITRGIVEAHCGSVTATCRPGTGATFTVTLPIAGPDTDRPWW